MGPEDGSYKLGSVRYGLNWRPFSKTQLFSTEPVISPVPRYRTESETAKVLNLVCRMIVLNLVFEVLEHIRPGVASTRPQPHVNFDDEACPCQPAAAPMRRCVRRCLRFVIWVNDSTASTPQPHVYMATCGRAAPAAASAKIPQLLARDGHARVRQA